MLRKNVASQFVHIAGVNASTGAIVTGATWTMRRCLDGTFAAGGATITEDGTTGFYKVALAQADTNGNDIGYFFTATSCVPVTINALATAADPSDSVRYGLTALPNAAAGANTGLPVVGTQVPNATAGAANGLFIAGTNAATTVTTSFTTTFTGNLTGSVASVTGAVGSVTGAVGSVTAAVTVGTNNDKTGYALSATGSAALTEGYAADGAPFTLNQGIYMIWSLLAERAISGTTLTAGKLDGTTAAMTFTLDDAVTPNTQTRAT